MIRQVRFVLLAAIVIAAWLFIGFDRFVGDHEQGSHWEPFIKRWPDMNLTFRNPAQQGLEIISPGELSLERREEFSHYCKVRYGLKDVSQCYLLIVASFY